MVVVVDDVFVVDVDVVVNADAVVDVVFVTVFKVGVNV